MHALRIWTAIFALVACAAGCASQEQDLSLQPSELQSRALKVVGQELRDGLGRRVLLRGFAAGGRAKMPPFFPFEFESGEFEAAAESYFTALQRLGANVVRLVLSWEALEPTAGSYDALYLQRYRQMLDAAHAHGMAVVVDFHQDIFASPFCGDGFPLWALGSIPHGEPRYDCSSLEWGTQYFNSSGPVAQAFDRLWNNSDGLQDSMEAMWRHVARSIGDHPAVAAFEVINEPGAGSVEAVQFASSTLPEFYARMGSAIQQELGYEVAIFGGGPAGDPQAEAEDLSPPELEGFVYAPHYYDPVLYLGLSAFSRSGVEQGLDQAFRHCASWQVPGFLGEFGGQNSNSAKGDYIAHVLDQLDRLLLGGTVWEASLSDQQWNHEDFSVLAGDGSEQWWAARAVRAYPRAVAGELQSFRWDEAAGRLELQVGQAREGVSEVYLPARHLGKAPRIEVQGARWRWLPEQELLLLSARPGASCSVTVSATLEQ